MKNAIREDKEIFAIFKPTDKEYEKLKAKVKEGPNFLNASTISALREQKDKRFVELKNMSKKGFIPDSETFLDKYEQISEQKDNEIDINKLCNCILHHIHHYSSRSIAFVSKLSELLGLGSTYFTTQSHATISKFLKIITTAEIQKLLEEFFKEKTDTFNEKTALFYPDGQDKFKLSNVFYELYDKKLHTLDKNFPRTFYLQNNLIKFVQNTHKQCLSSSVISDLKTSPDEEKILDAVLAKFFDTFSDEKYSDFSHSFNKRQFFTLLLEKLLINNAPEKFKELLDNALKEDDNALKEDDIALKKEKSNLYCYAYCNLYNFTFQTLKTFHYISKVLGLGFDLELIETFHSDQCIKRYENIEEDIEKFFGYDKSTINEEVTDEEINKIYNSKDLFSEFNAKIKSVYNDYEDTIDSQQSPPSCRRSRSLRINSVSHKPLTKHHNENH